MGAYRMWGTLLVLCSLFAAGYGIMCSVCDSKTDSGCRGQPPPPVNCTICRMPMPDGSCAIYMHFNYCLTVEKFDENSTLVSFTRSCSPITSRGKPYYCKTGEENNKKTKMCFFFCDTDGCNTGYTSKASSIGILLGLLVTWAMNMLGHSDCIGH